MSSKPVLSIWITKLLVISERFFDSFTTLWCLVTTTQLRTSRCSTHRCWIYSMANSIYQMIMVYKFTRAVASSFYFTFTGLVIFWKLYGRLLHIQGFENYHWNGLKKSWVFKTFQYLFRWEYLQHLFINCFVFTTSKHKLSKIYCKINSQWNTVVYLVLLNCMSLWRIARVDLFVCCGKVPYERDTDVHIHVTGNTAFYSSLKVVEQVIFYGLKLKREILMHQLQQHYVHAFVFW